ncbi:hypothetical protein DD238_003193 [Peronospora effusa]|uniref:Uncharacterized protein n=1 Tax=Peronospora effusa TaxID=542832 RepID=A0A3M6VDJ6_9STRA|nr:hypothetical protein DD238_003193 [Peronospora effusa]
MVVLSDPDRVDTPTGLSHTDEYAIEGDEYNDNGSRSPVSSESVEKTDKCCLSIKHLSLDSSILTLSDVGEADDKLGSREDSQL